MTKYAKENYITSRETPDAWEYHVNVKTMIDLSSFITGSVLDVGCNHGGTTYWLKDQNVSSITGIDINGEALDLARNNLSKLDISNKFVVLDLTVERLDEIFDTVVSFHTLEHIYPEDTDIFISNIYNMLKEDGYFIVSIPYEDAYHTEIGEHVSFYNEESLNEVMERNNFKTIKSFKEDSYDEKDILTGVYKK
jgi:cyclopropane fatty-acyl-phospholipid synthase-like methyltransferase